MTAIVAKGALDSGSTFGVWLLHSTWKGGRASLVLIHPLNLLRAGPKRHTPGPRLSRSAKLRERVMLTWHHWVKNLCDAGYPPGRMKFLQELNGYVFKAKASHLDGGHRVRDGEGWAPHYTLHTDDNQSDAAPRYKIADLRWLCMLSCKLPCIMNVYLSKL